MIISNKDLDYGYHFSQLAKTISLEFLPQFRDICRDIIQVIEYFPEDYPVPEIEYDESTGHITFRWLYDDYKNMKYMHFCGNKKIVGGHIEQEKTIKVIDSWTILCDDKEQILRTYIKK